MMCFALAGGCGVRSASGFVGWSAARTLASPTMPNPAPQRVSICRREIKRFCDIGSSRPLVNPHEFVRRQDRLGELLPRRQPILGPGVTDKLNARSHLFLAWLTTIRQAKCQTAAFLVLRGSLLQSLRK